MELIFNEISMASILQIVGPEDDLTNMSST
jgi:hypothetical protein